MKIAYLLHHNEAPESSGILRWVMMETQYWQAMGHDVHVFIYSSRQYTSADIGNLPLTVRQYQGMRDRFGKVNALSQDIVAFKPDVVRMTYDPYYPGMKAVFQQFPVVVDIHSDDTHEYRLGAKQRYWYNRLTRHQIFRQAKGLLFVTHEMATRKHLNPFDKPYTVIANAIDLSQYTPLPPVDNPNPRLVFIGTPNQSWHGLDKIIKLATHFPQWHFDLIGPTKQGLGGDVPANIVAHGYLKRAAYETVVAQADVAFGTMALHRKNMEEACAYKVREYCAYGIPIIIGYQDTDFPDSYPFICQLPNTEDNIDTHKQQIEQFVLANKGKRIPREAVAHLDVQVKEAARLTFFEKIISE